MDSGQALVDAMLFGKLEGVSEEMLFLFARTGLIHLFSASGFHLWASRKVAGWVAWPFERSLPVQSKKRDWIRFLAAVGLMTFFGQATDWSSPMVRAYVFSCLLATAALLELRPHSHWIFTLSLLCSSVLGKGSKLSFLLSACGMAGVLYIQPRRSWAIALGPWLFTLPITLYAFGLFPLLAPIWNLTFGLALSWLVLPPAIVALLLRSLHCPSEWLERATAELMHFLVSALATLEARLSFSYWVPPLSWVFATSLLLLSLYGWKHARKGLLYGGALAAALLALLSPHAILVLLDVGQGDALLLRRMNGKLLLSDLGPPGYQGGSAPVTRALESLGVGSLDDILLSHFDLDHRGGLDSLLARHAVRGALWFREDLLAAKHGEEVLLAAERASLPIRFITPSQAPAGLRCWLAPAKKSNDFSPLCLAELASREKIWLTGDMSSRAEEWFLAHIQPLPPAQFLKLAHHGSKSSSSEAFLRASGAREALIGVGKFNRYHHPSPETLGRLQALGIATKRTDQSGTTVFYRIWERVTSLFQARARASPSRKKACAGRLSDQFA